MLLPVKSQSVSPENPCSKRFPETGSAFLSAARLPKVQTLALTEIHAAAQNQH